MCFAREYFAANPVAERLECRATTRRGTPCQRTPLPHNGYCPSHQHLAETEDVRSQLAACIASVHARCCWAWTWAGPSPTPCWPSAAGW